jgi:hypothetical protein
MEFVLLNGALLPGYIKLKIDIILANASQGAVVIHIVQRDSLVRGEDLSTNTVYNRKLFNLQESTWRVMDVM